METVYLALGANVGDAAGNIEHAVELLSEKLHDIRRAPVYVSKAVGYTDQPDFHNTAISGKTDLPPVKLLKFVKSVEQQVGRIARFRWGPREIDIDIIFYGSQIVENDKLTIPHPRFHERDFVLQPLVDLDPKLLDPSSSRTVAELLNDLGPGQKSLI